MESVLYVQVVGEVWDQVYACITGNVIQAFARVRTDIPSSKVNKTATPMLEIPLKPGFVDCKVAKLGMSALSKLKKNANLPASLYFFNVNVFDADKGETTHKLASASEEERGQWLAVMKSYAVPDAGASPQKRAVKAAIGTSATASPYTPNTSNYAKLNNSAITNEDRDDDSISNVSGPSLAASAANGTPQARPTSSKAIPTNNRGSGGFNSPLGVVTPPPNRPPLPLGTNIRSGPAPNQDSEKLLNAPTGFDDLMMEAISGGADIDAKIDGNEAEELRLTLGPLSVKFTNLFRFVEVIFGFPGVILVDTFGPVNRSSWIYHKLAIYFINLLVTVAIPLLLSYLVLEKFQSAWVTRATLTAAFGGLYILPVACILCSKMYKESQGNNMVDGMFVFKPSHRVHLTFSNLLQFVGFVIEWALICFMALPVGLFADGMHVELYSYWPYIRYEYFYWVSIGLAYFSALLLMLTAVLRGKTLYKFVKSSLPWHCLFLIGNVLFLPIVIILLMSLWCDYTVSPALFAQDPTLECYGTKHGLYARLGFVTLSLFIVQHVLLPPGTFKETISGSLDIMFTPVYLSAHALTKVIYAGLYVFFYEHNLVRVPALTGVALFMLVLNSRMSPCCVSSINSIRNTIFTNASMVGTMTTAFLVYNKLYDNGASSSNAADRKWLYLYILISSAGFNWIFALVSHYFNKVYTEGQVASQLVDIENSVHGNGINSRALEPLIAMSLSGAGITAPMKSALVAKNGASITAAKSKATVNQLLDDSTAARKYIPQLIAMITHRAERVQFQGIWAISTLSLRDEEARVAIHEAGGSKLLLKNYESFSPLVQLETLAALANLTLSDTVAEAMVRQFNCIPLFMHLVNSHRPKHGLFALICIGNLTRREMFREQIRCANGIQTMVSCLMSHDYHKRKFGALALSNMALSVSEELDSIFRTRGLIDRIVKMAKRKEIETQKEVVALVRNLACHSRLRPVLLNSGILSILNSFRDSEHAHVAKWADEIYNLMQREINMGSLEDYRGADNNAGRKQRGMLDAEAVSKGDKEYLAAMEPLSGSVEWDAWGSKTEAIFGMLIERTPPIQSKLSCETQNNEPLLLNLSMALDLATFVRWKNAAKYIITVPAKFGDISIYDPEVYESSSETSPVSNKKNISLVSGSVVSDSDCVVYTPRKGSIGNDRFTFVIQLGAVISRPCELTITLDNSGVDHFLVKTRCFCFSSHIDEPASPKAPKKQCFGCCCGKGSKQRKEDYAEDEYGHDEQAADNSV